jgi:hypothetical protein
MTHLGRKPFNRREGNLQRPAPLRDHLLDRPRDLLHGMAGYETPFKWKDPTISDQQGIAFDAGYVPFLKQKGQQ